MRENGALRCHQQDANFRYGGNVGGCLGTRQYAASGSLDQTLKGDEAG